MLTASTANVPSIRKIGGTIVDHSPTVRVKSYEHMSPHALLCAVAGRHIGFITNDPVCAPVDGWGPIRSAEVHYRCDCTRWKYEVVDLDTGDTISRSTQYGGGELLELGGRPSQKDAKKLWLEQVQERRAAAIRKADEAAALEERAAVAEHKAEVAKKPRRRTTRKAT